MSARSFKIFLGVILAHMVILSFLWVGFPVPSARTAAAFIYEGTLPVPQDSGNNEPDVGPVHKESAQVTFDRFEAAHFNHWIKLRDPSKS